MTKKRREMVWAKIPVLSFCKCPATGIEPVLKSDGKFKVYGVSKSIDEKRQMAFVVWPADRGDYVGDFARAEFVEKMAHESLRDGLKTTVEHEGEPIDAADCYLAESFVIQKSDPRFEGLKDGDGKPVDATGGWGTIYQATETEGGESIWQAFKAGDLNGISIEGDAKFRHASPIAKSADLVTEFITKLAIKCGLVSETDEEDDVKEADVKKMLDESEKRITKSILGAIEKGAAKKSKRRADEDDETEEIDESEEDEAIEKSESDDSDGEGETDDVDTLREALAKSKRENERLKSKSRIGAGAPTKRDTAATVSVKKRAEYVEKIAKAANQRRTEDNDQRRRRFVHSQSGDSFEIGQA